MLSALIFDLDGTLIDTTHVYADAARQAFRAFGISYTDEEFMQLAVGVPQKIWLRQKGIPENDIPAICAKRDALVLEYLAKEAVWSEGVEDALQGLAERFPLAICTGAWTKSIDAIDRLLGLRDIFPVIIDGDAVKPRFKPDPLGLLIAAGQLGIVPGSCAYIGDQLFDMQAAKNAGMTAILIPGSHTTVTAELESTADHVFADWQQWKDYMINLPPQSSS